MKSIFGYLSGAALGLLLVPAAAYAQTTTTTTTDTYGIGSCTSSTDMNVVLAGTSQLKVGGTLIPQASGGAIFNQAECQCQSRDIDLHFTLTQGTGLGGAVPAAEMWIGQSDCGDPNMRATKLCDQVLQNNPPNNNSWVLNGSQFQTVGMFDVSVPPEVVTNPKPGTGGYTCSTSGVTNQTITVTIGSPTAPAVCTMPVEVTTQGPIAPQNVGVAKGDGGLVINWSVPLLTGGIENYQILCRKTSAPTQIAMSEDFLNSSRYYFSSCISGHLYRRWPGGLQLANDPATTLNGVPLSGDAFPLDPRLRCSDRIPASATSLSTRITGLENGEQYEVMVVAIDSYGNATPSTTVMATPQANAAVLSEYCDGASCPGFGCQAGRGVPTSGGAAVTAAGILGLLALARRARRVA